MTRRRCCTYFRLGYVRKNNGAPHDGLVPSTVADRFYEVQG